MFDHDHADPSAVRGVTGLLTGAALGGTLWAALYFAATGVSALFS